MKRQRYNVIRFFALAAVFCAAINLTAQVNIDAPQGLSNRSVTKTKTKPATPESGGESKQKESTASKSENSSSENVSKPRKSSSTSTSRPSTSSSTSSAQNKPVTSRGQRKVGSHHSGWRVEAYRDNNAKRAKVKSRERAKEIAMKFPGYRVYITYKAPSWRLRIGDFTNEEDARNAARRMRRAFDDGKHPWFRDFVVVRDHINIWR